MKKDEEAKQYSLSPISSSTITSEKYLLNGSTIKKYENTKEFVTSYAKIYLESNDTTLKNNISLSSSKDSIFYIESPEKKLEKRITKCKKRIITLLVDEDITVGYSSRTQDYLVGLLLKNEDILVKEAIGQLYQENVDNYNFTYKLIEVMSNLDYKKLFPTNTLIAFSSVNHQDIRIQEAAIASIEKWEDSKNIKYLRNINYTTKWIEEYAKNVIDYLESCG